MKETIDVNTGEVKVATGTVVLRSVAIGSCVVVAAYDLNRKIGAMAHIMLPGRASKNSPEKTKYAADAISRMVDKMVVAGAVESDIDVCLVGAGNVLQKKDDTICKDNIVSTIHILKERKINVKAAVLGGTKRKGVCLEVESGEVSYTEGDISEKLLWKPRAESA